MQNYIQESLSRGQLNMELISKALDHLKARSFHHQLKSQSEDVRFERYDVDMSEFKNRVVDPTSTIIRKRYMAYVEFDMISLAKKLRYKRSDMYRKEISLYDIQSRRDIFDYNYMTFIDGKLVDFINIIASDTGTQLVFNRENGVDKYGLSKPEFDELMQPGKTLSIFFLPNTAYGAYSLQAETLLHYSHMLSLQETGIAANLIDEGSYVSFINNNEYGFKSQLIVSEKAGDLLRFYDVPAKDKAHVNIFGFKYLHKIIDLPVGQDFFYIDYVKMPVPIENIIPFEINTDGSHSFAHHIGIRHHYPNMYTIQNRTIKPVKLLLFYNTNIDSNTPEYVNEIGYYLEAKQYDALIDDALDYSPQKFTYNMDDFKNSPEYPDHNAYKLRKFTDWYMTNSEYMRDYLADIFNESTSIYIRMENVDVQERLRMNNHEEINELSAREEFDEERVLIIVRNEKDSHIKSRVYIDGLVYKLDKMYKRGNYEYIYIPSGLLTETSIIEIERFDTSLHVIPFNVSLGSTHTNIMLPSKMSVAPDDIIIIDDNGLVLDKSLYEIKFPVKNGELISIEEVTKQSSFVDFITFVPTHDGFTDRSFTLQLRKDFLVEEFNIEQDADASMTFTLPGNINVHDKRVFVYYNRRLVQPEIYSIERTNVQFEVSQTNITLNGFVYKPGDVVTIYVLPITYKTVLADRFIPNSGVVDLRGRIDIPFDLKWHETFVNGRFIHKGNIEIISPEIVALKDILSNKNLVILSKNDYSLGLQAPSVNNIMNKLFDKDASFSQMLSNLFDLTDSVTEDDFLIDTLIHILYELKEFFERELLSSIKFINPDLLQFTPELASKYPNMITNPNGIRPITYESINVAMLNPDINAETSRKVYHIKPEPTE